MKPKSKKQRTGAKTAPQRILGVDFGTSNCCAAVSTAGAVSEIVQYGEFEDMVPSCVFVDDEDQIQVGQVAAAQGLLHPERFRERLKIDLIRTSSIWLGSREYTPAALISSVLSRVSEKATAQLGSAADSTVLTVPATYTNRESSLMAQAADAAGMRGVSIIPEPVAAARYYALTGQLELEPGQTALVYDFGGGTFDATLVERTKDDYLIPGPPGGLPDCGGSDIDVLLLHELLRGEPETRRSEVLDDGEGSVRLRHDLLTLCRRAKHAFADPAQFVVESPLPYGYGFVQKAFRIERARFSELIGPLVERTLDCCDDVIRAAGRNGKDLAAILPVGGGSHLTLVREMLHRRFGCPIVVRTKPQLVVCLGAAAVDGHGMIGFDIDRWRPAVRPPVISRSAHVEQQLTWFQDQLTGLRSALTALAERHPRIRKGGLKTALDAAFAELEVAGARLTHPVFRITTISTTSAGKSTLVNALIGRQLAPMSDQEMSAGILLFRDRDGLAMKVKDTRDRKWPLDYRDKATQPLSDAGIYSFLRDDVMKAYHRAAGDGLVAMPEIEVEAPLLATRSKDFLDLPEGVTLEICDLPGLNSTNSDDRSLRVIQEQMKHTFCLMAIDYTQTDAERRNKLLDEMVRVVHATLGKPDSIVFVLNKYDARGPADSAEEARELLEELRVQIQERLELASKPDLLPLNARLWSMAQMAWGPSGFDQAPAASPEVRAATLADIKRYCANNLEAMLDTDSQFAEWYEPRIKASPRAPLAGLSDEDLRDFLVRFVYPSTGAETLLREIRQRVRERFATLVIWPAIADAVQKCEAFLGQLRAVVASQERLVSTKLEDLIESAEQRREAVRRSIEKESGIFVKALAEAKAGAEAAATLDEGSRGKIEQRVINHLVAVDIDSRFYRMIVGMRPRALHDLTSNIIEPLTVTDWKVENRDKLERQLSNWIYPATAESVARDYDDYLARLADWKHKANEAILQVEAFDAAGKKRGQAALAAHGSLIDEVARALAERAQYFLTEQAATIEYGLNEMLGSLHDRLHELAKQEAGIEAVLAGGDRRERPKKFRIPENLFELDAVTRPERQTIVETKARVVERRRWWTLFLVKHQETVHEDVERSVMVYKLPGPKLIGNEMVKLSNAATAVMGKQLTEWALKAFESYRKDLLESADRVSSVVLEELERQRGNKDKKLRDEGERWNQIGSQISSPRDLINDIREGCSLRETGS